jgi:hypothetical protein
MVGAVLEWGDFDPGRSGRNHLRTLALPVVYAAIAGAAGIMLTNRGDVA